MEKSREDSHSLCGVSPSAPATHAGILLLASHLLCQPPGLLVDGWEELPGNQTPWLLHAATTWRALGTRHCGFSLEDDALVLCPDPSPGPKNHSPTARSSVCC